jgi:hypothetical protein
VKENVYSLPPIMLTHQILDVDFGIGIIKNALSALINGFSMPKENVLQFQINAKLTLKTEIALNATRDTT